MARFSYYVSSPEGFRAARSDLLTSVTGLPAWGRFIVLLLAIPGVVLIALSLLALMASIAALLLLTMPAYAVLRRLSEWLRGTRRDEQVPQTHVPVVERPARRVEATVIGSE
jgi:hypothetical protein